MRSAKLDKLDTWLNTKEQNAPAILTLYHEICLRQGEAPTYLREPVDRILALILRSARVDYPCDVLFNWKHLKSTSAIRDDDQRAQAPEVATRAALEVAERALRSTELLKPGQRGPTTIAQRLKTKMRAAMRIVAEQYEVPSREEYKRAKSERRAQQDAESGDQQAQALNAEREVATAAAQKVPTLEPLHESAAGAYDGPEITRSARYIDWQQDEDADTRQRRPRSGRMDPITRSGLLADGHSFRRYAYLSRGPWNPLLTPKDRDRIQREADARREAERRYVEWAIGLRRRVGGFVVADYDRLVSVAKLKLELIGQEVRDETPMEHATEDPLEAASAGNVAKRVAALMDARRNEAAKLRRQALVVLAGPAEVAEPATPNLTALADRRRPLSAAERQRKSRATRKAAAELRDPGKRTA